MPTFGTFLIINQKDNVARPHRNAPHGTRRCQPYSLSTRLVENRRILGFLLGSLGSLLFFWGHGRFLFSFPMTFPFFGHGFRSLSMMNVFRSTAVPGRQILIKSVLARCFEMPIVKGRKICPSEEVENFFVWQEKSRK